MKILLTNLPFLRPTAALAAATPPRGSSTGTAGASGVLVERIAP